MDRHLVEIAFSLPCCVSFAKNKNISADSEFRRRQFEVIDSAGAPNYPASIYPMIYSRPERPSLQASNFDVAIIGGGINGAAIARECTLAGRRVFLAEKGDFASGTTSRATRIIHGGLRYLEHGEIGLVREALHERERLLLRHPHLVRPLQFLLALETGGMRNAFFVRTGLWLYRQMGAGVPIHPASTIAATR